MPDARHDKRTSWMFASAPAAERSARARRAERPQKARTAVLHRGPRHAHSAHA
ncbi:MAG TPA: hypothetical protein VLV82_04895 [Candidatus Angelobacter sp.]|nr:hypothetical protein [Candidatus Angelobacter sp.]